MLMLWPPLMYSFVRVLAEAAPAVERGLKELGEVDWAKAVLEGACTQKRSKSVETSVGTRRGVEEYRGVGVGPQGCGGGGDRVMRGERISEREMREGGGKSGCRGPGGRER